jgi:hypothetical protein
MNIPFLIAHRELWHFAWHTRSHIFLSRCHAAPATRIGQHTSANVSGGKERRLGILPGKKKVARKMIRIKDHPDFVICWQVVCTVTMCLFCEYTKPNWMYNFSFDFAGEIVHFVLRDFHAKYIHFQTFQHSHMRTLTYIRFLLQCAPERWREDPNQIICF